MKVLSIIDSFKGTISSKELGQIITNVLQTKNIDADYLPIADGGDGFLEAITDHINGKLISIIAHDPLGRIIKTSYIIDCYHNIAYLELARISGISLLTENELNPNLTSTFGLGEVIKDVINKGIKKIIVGIGGSATNDGGTGMLEALGVKFYNKENKQIHSLSGQKLDQIHDLDLTYFNEIINDIEFIIMNDVSNPLLGEKGATHVFGPQKGVINVDNLEKKMTNYANIVTNTINNDVTNFPGSGAAGGVGFAFKAFFEAKFHPGIEYILDLIDFTNLAKKYDYIITGEGKLDHQSFDGKVISGIYKRVNSQKIILVTAINDLDKNILSKYNIKKVYAIVDEVSSLEESITNPHQAFTKLCQRINLM